MKKIQELKLYLKAQASAIKEARINLKNTQRSGKDASRMQASIGSVVREYRHHHIAYCELRGRTRDQIETPRENNLPNERLIDKIKETYAWEVCDETEANETLRAS
jgi:hypothetical protein